MGSGDLQDAHAGGQDWESLVSQFFYHPLMQYGQILQLSPVEGRSIWIRQIFCLGSEFAFKIKL
jgi:hypothetical protein